MSTHESEEKKHSGFGQRLKGAAHVVHGIGEDIRGSVMGAFESVSGSDEAKAKDEDIAAKGKAEIEQGIAQMKGVEVPGSTTAGPKPHGEGKTGDQPQEQPTKDVVSDPTSAPPPSPTQNRQLEPEAIRQEQTGAENLQSSQVTQAALEAKSPQTEEKGPVGV